MRDGKSPATILKSHLRVAATALAALAVTLFAVADGAAQSRNNGISTNAGRGPVDGGSPRGRGPVPPRFPGNFGPPGLGPIGPTGPIIVNPGPQQPQQGVAQPKQNPQIVQRSGFNAPPPGETRFVPNEVLLSIAPTVPDTMLDVLARGYNLTRLESQQFEGTGRRLFRWRINDGRPVALVIRTLQNDPRFLSAQPNYLYALQEDAAAKPEPAATLAQYALDKLHLQQAHALALGDNVIVALIDTPVDISHVELAGVVTATFDATGTAGKPLPHGTAMAGAIAAHNKLMGSAPRVKILSVQAFGATRSEGTSFDILKGLDWAIKQRADVINMSFGGPADAELQAMLAKAREKGIVLVAAAGNAGPKSPPLYPAADPNVIAVTATDVDDHLYDRANRGPYIAVAAPGVDILVVAPDGGYRTTSGTSVAAAEVTGIVALMLERNRTLDPAAVRKLLMATARDLGPAGRDDQFGAGLADALGVLNALEAKPAALPQAVDRAEAPR